MPININKNNFDKEIKNEKLPIIIDVYATWCSPCQKMTPIFSELEKEYSGKCKFVAVNVDEARDLSIIFGVTSVPTFIFFYKGEIQFKDTGFMNKDSLKNKIDDFLLSIN